MRKLSLVLILALEVPARVLGQTPDTFEAITASIRYVQPEFPAPDIAVIAFAKTPIAAVYGRHRGLSVLSKAEAPACLADAPKSACRLPTPHTPVFIYVLEISDQTAGIGIGWVNSVVKGRVGAKTVDLELRKTSQGWQVTRERAREIT